MLLTAFQAEKRERQPFYGHYAVPVKNWRTVLEHPPYMLTNSNQCIRIRKNMPKFSSHCLHTIYIKPITVYITQHTRYI